jgi:ubiquinone/menaquinone biosynthesis C-methylase UbiE
MDMSYLKYLAAKGVSHIHPRGKQATRMLLELLHLDPGLRILEIGCGTGGSLVQALAFADLNLYGVDLLESMIETAGKRLDYCDLSTRAHLAVADVRKLPYSDRAFDRVIIESVLGFQAGERLPEFIREVYRVLKAGGLCGLNEAIWLDSVAPEQIEQITEESTQHYGLPPATRDGWFLHDWQMEFSTAGFNILRSEPLDQDSIPFQAALSARAESLLALSEKYSRRQRFRSGMRIKSYLDRINYRRRLRSTNHQDQILEARIYILEKPAS